MAKKINFINEIQGADVTANEAVKNSVPTWANREKTDIQNHDHVLKLELELELSKKMARAIASERRKADKREAEQRRDFINAMVAMTSKYSDAVEKLASMGIAYAQVTPSGVASEHNARLRDEATCNANCDRTALHIEDEATVQDASVREAKKATAKTTTAKTTAKKTAKTGNGGKKYTPKAKQGVKYEDEYTVTAKNSVVYKVGHFHHTKTDEELWAVSALEYSEDAKTWLKDTFGVHWSPYAGGFLFNYKPDTYLRRGVAKKTTAKKTTAKKNA